MKPIRLAWLELRRFRGPLRRLVPVVLILVPLLYGSLYLWSNWDPYGRLSRVPVAVVNSDRPVDADGQHINAGQQFTDQLKATDLFDWHFTSGAEARRGLTEGRYYFTITVPADFSAKLATATKTTPERAAVRITKNDANGYIVGIMADTVKSELQNQINAAAHAAYARAVYRELNDVRDKLRLASEASGQLVRGTDLGKQGTTALTNGLGGVRDGAGQVTQGAHTVSAATAQLDQQITEVTGFAAEQLPAAVNGLVNTSNTAVGGLSVVKTGTGFVRDRAVEGLGALQELGTRHPDLGADPLYQRAVDGSRRLAATTANTDDAAARALSNAQDAQSRAVSLQQNMGALQERVRAISTPADTLSTGSTQIAAGSGGVTTGLSTLAGSSGVLQAGADQLSDGAKRLDGLVDDTLHKVPPTNPTQVARAADVLGSPSEIKTANLNPAYVYGRGLAPFFFSIALWVFGLFAYLLLRPVNLRALGRRTHPLAVTLGGWLPAAGLGILGGLVLFAVVDFGLGLSPVDLLGTLGVISLGAVTFVAIDHFLRTALGAVGDLLSLVLLIVQLTACGGLYPLETAPAPFRAVHPYLPMSYLVDALRVTISGGLPDHLRTDAIVLAGFLVVFLVLTTLVVWRQRTWTVSRLHPQIEL